MSKKKLINNPESVVDEALAGLVAVHPGLRLLEGHRVVVRADIETVTKEGKVGDIYLLKMRELVQFLQTSIGMEQRSMKQN